MVHANEYHADTHRQEIPTTLNTVVLDGAINHATDARARDIALAIRSRDRTLKISHVGGRNDRMTVMA